MILIFKYLKYLRLAVVLLIIQWSFKHFHFWYRHLKVLTEVAFLTCRGREFQMVYITIRTKSSYTSVFKRLYNIKHFPWCCWNTRLDAAEIPDLMLLRYPTCLFVSIHFFCALRKILNKCPFCTLYKILNDMSFLYIT